MAFFCNYACTGYLANSSRKKNYTGPKLLGVAGLLTMGHDPAGEEDAKQAGSSAAGPWPTGEGEAAQVRAVDAGAVSEEPRRRRPNSGECGARGNDDGRVSEVGNGQILARGSRIRRCFRARRPETPSTKVEWATPATGISPVRRRERGLREAAKTKEEEDGVGEEGAGVGDEAGVLGGLGRRRRTAGREEEGIVALPI